MEPNDTNTPLLTDELPKPKLDMPDVLTLMTRILMSLILSAMTVFYGTGGNYLFMIVLGTIALVLQIAAIRMINRMRAENPEYIAALAKQQEAARLLKQARR